MFVCLCCLPLRRCSSTVKHQCSQTVAVCVPQSVHNWSPFSSSAQVVKYTENERETVTGSRTLSALSLSISLICHSLTHSVSQSLIRWILLWDATLRVLPLFCCCCHSPKNCFCCCLCLVGESQIGALSRTTVALQRLCVCGCVGSAGTVPVTHTFSVAVSPCPVHSLHFTVGVVVAALYSQHL